MTLSPGVVQTPRKYHPSYSIQTPPPFQAAAHRSPRSPRPFPPTYCRLTSLAMNGTRPVINGSVNRNRSFATGLSDLCRCPCPSPYDPDSFTHLDYRCTIQPASFLSFQHDHQIAGFHLTDIYFVLFYPSVVSRLQSRLLYPLFLRSVVTHFPLLTRFHAVVRRTLTPIQCNYNPMPYHVRILVLYPPSCL